MAFQGQSKVIEETDPRTVPLDLQSMHALPPLQVQAFNAHLFLERLSLFIDELVFFVILGSLIIASAVLGIVSSENLDRDTHNQSKPEDGDELQQQQGSKERIFDASVIANMASWVVKGFNQIFPAGRWVNGSNKVAVAALKATRWHNLGGMSPDRPTDHEVGDMAEQDPGNEKQAKSNIAKKSVAKVLQAFGKLCIALLD